MTFISGGYFITTITPRQEYRSSEFVPSQIISASNCLVPIIPANWAFNWQPERNLQDRLQQAAKFGILEENTLPLCQRITELEMQGKVGFDRTFFALETAREIVKEFIPATPDLMVLGIGLHHSYVENLLEVTGPGPTGIYDAISNIQPLSPGGENIGYDVTGYGRFGEFHSWMCGGLEEEVYQRFGFKPGKLGLFETYKEANQVATFIQEANELFERVRLEQEGRSELQPLPSMKGEPGLWLPWLVVRYSLNFG